MKTIVKPKSRATSLKLGFDGSPEGLPQINAYVFDKKDRLIEMAPLVDGQINLKTKAADLPFHNLLVAPARDLDTETVPTLDSVRHRHAYAPMVYRSDLELLPVPELNWTVWCFDTCRVNGRVVKPIYEGGEVYLQPVCGAKVHICEVDPISLVIDRIPEEVVLQFRREMLRLPEVEIPVFGAAPQPSPPGKLIQEWQRLNEKSRLGSGLPQAAVHSSVKLAAAPTAAKVISPETVAHMAMMKKAPSAEMLSAAILPQTAQRQLALATTAPQVRQFMAANVQLLVPYLCLAYWYWPYFYRCDELRVVETDAQGRFATDVYYQCFGDKPDLYFWVEYPIGGVDTVVYNPPIACNTYWNYDCGTEVTIRVVDDRVQGCDEIPDVIGCRVDVRKIGNAGFISEIQQQPTSLTFQNAAPIQTQGTIRRAIDHGNNFPKPFGGTLGLRVDFGSELIDKGVTHYRWSYRRFIETGPKDSWKVLDAPTYRRYIEEVGMPKTNKHVPYQLGPFIEGGEILFRIPHTRAGDLPVANPDGNTRYWMAEAFNTSVLNTLFGGSIANLQSDDILVADAERAKRLTDAGLYEFKFELFEDVSSGTPKVVEMPREDWLMPPAIDPSTGDSVAAPDEYLILTSGGKASGFTFKVMIDNNPVSAVINDVEVDGRNSDPICGFVAYDNKLISDATLSFLADHPNKWATFSFNTTKGNGNHLSLASASGMVMGSLDVNGDSVPDFVQDSAGEFSAVVAVDALLGGCDSAAFAETLKVLPLATDGSNRLRYLDRAYTAAFAMEPFDAE